MSATAQQVNASLNYEYWRSIATRIAVLVLVVFSAGGCSDKELVDGLSSKDAVEVLVVLNRAGIEAEKIASGSGRNASYSIFVSEKNVSKANEILLEYELLGTDSNELEQLIKPEGFIPESLQMSELRRDLMLGAQVERLLNALPGVIGVRAVVRSSEKDSDLAETANMVSRATVVIRYLSSSGKPFQSVDEIRQMISQTVPGLAPDNVVVKLSRVVLPDASSNAGMAISGDGQVVNLSSFAPFKFQVPTSERSAARQQLAIAVMFFCLCGCTVGYFFGRRGSRAKSAGKRGSASGSSFFLEAEATSADSSQKRASGPRHRSITKD